jgi:hypothetical protein
LAFEQGGHRPYVQRNKNPFVLSGAPKVRVEECQRFDFAQH